MPEASNNNEPQPQLKRDPFALELLTQVQLSGDRHLTVRTFAAQEISSPELNALLDKIFLAVDRSQAIYQRKELARLLEMQEKRLAEMLERESEMLSRLTKAADGSERRKEYKPGKQEEAEQKQHAANIKHTEGEIETLKKSIVDCDAKINPSQ